MMNSSRKISLSMIVKNEEKYLRGCLESVKGIVDELVIVDTGSNDNTLKIAEEFGAKLYNYEWSNDFSEARNYALSKCTCGWILYLDADERLSDHSISELRKIKSSGKLTGCKCTVINPDDFNGKPNYMRYTRLFPNNPSVRFTGAVHEQIDDSLLENKYEIIETGIEIIHTGYNVPYEEIKGKAQRNLIILESEYEKDTSAYNAFQLANTYSILKEYDEANKYYLISVKGEIKNEYKAHAYLNLSDFELKRHNVNGALEFLNTGLQNDSSNPLLNLLASDIYLRMNLKEKALEFCKTAYRENKKIFSGLSKAELAVGIKPEVILSKGIYLSLFVGDKDNLNYFLPELMKENKRLFDVFEKLINNKTISDIDEIEIMGLISVDNIEGFLFLVENYADKLKALELLLAIGDKFKGNSRFLRTLGLIYSENRMYNESVEVFEKSLLVEEKDPAALFYLISVLVQSNQVERIPELLLFAEKEFGDIPEFNQKFKILKEKLSFILNKQES